MGKKLKEQYKKKKNLEENVFFCGSFGFFWGNSWTFWILFKITMASTKSYQGYHWTPKMA